MSSFDHPNVLTLIGVCLDGGPAPYLVMPFMFNGNLLSYLKNKRDDLVLPPQQEMDSNGVSCFVSRGQGTCGYMQIITLPLVMHMGYN